MSSKPSKCTEAEMDPSSSSSSIELDFSSSYSPNSLFVWFFSQIFMGISLVLRK
jgi:hypothetical protein